MSLDQQILHRLRTVKDPELGIDIVSLGLIYQAEFTKDAQIRVQMTLTSPGCPLAGVIDQMIRDAVFDLVHDPADVQISIVFDPPWTPDMMSEEARLMTQL